MSTARLRVLVPTGLVVVLILAMWQAATAQRRAAEHAAMRVQLSQRLLTSMLDQETGLRGYQLTYREEFLDPYVRGQAAFTDTLASLRHDVHDGPSRRALAVAATAAFTWQRAARSTLETSRAQLPGDRGVSTASLLDRKALMDDFRARQATLERSLVKNGHAATTRVAVVWSLLTALAFLALGTVATLLWRRNERERRALRDTEREHRDDQEEFQSTMQVVRSEEEAHDLLRRHLERRRPGREVVVMSANNSADRLEPRSARPYSHRVLEHLAGKEPRDCVAVRLARPYEQGEEHETLLRCGICHGLGASRCAPLLAGGDVIGSVLVLQPETIDEPVRRSLRESVVQAAPVLGNLRTLAVAEARAMTDALTGLPNRRAINDSLRRMIAQAGRSVQPLGLIALDLDHFKLVNDRFGHDGGDDVLAAVAATMQHVVRASDFVGRLGGEEFIILAPDTGAAGILTLAETVRAAIAELEVEGVLAPITASLGVATLPADAVSPDDLMRHADRALYAAKEAGRDRVMSLNAPGAPEPGT